MLTARDNSNVFLMDRVRAKERMQALTATTHIIEDAEIEAMAYLVVLGITLTFVTLVWVML